MQLEGNSFAEIISRTTRDMRMGQYQNGGTYRDTRRQTKYDITRVLKVGSNELRANTAPRAASYRVTT